MVIFAVSGYYYYMLKEWIQLCSLWLVSRNEFDSDRPVWPQKGVVDLVHGLPNRVLHTEVSNQAYQQHVQVLLSKPPSCAHPCAVAEWSKEKWMDIVCLGGRALRNRFGGFNRSRFLLLIALLEVFWF